MVIVKTSCPAAIYYQSMLLNLRPACIPSSGERSIHAPRLDCNTKFSTGTRVHTAVQMLECTRVGSTVDLDLPQTVRGTAVYTSGYSCITCCRSKFRSTAVYTPGCVCVHTHTGRSTDLPDVYTAVCVHTHLLFFVFSKKSTPAPRLNCVIVEFSSNLFSVKGVLCF